MTSLDAVTAWVGNYRKAWESNDPQDIADLFAEDAAYFTEPFAKPWIGRDKIVTKWLKAKDKPGSTTFEWHPVIVTEDLAIIQATTQYPKRTFSNLGCCAWINLARPDSSPSGGCSIRRRTADPGPTSAVIESTHRWMCEFVARQADCCEWMRGRRSAGDTFY